MAGFDFEDDTITLSTPEGVGIDLALAGLGSRFVAMLIDQTVITLTLLALAVLAGLFTGTSGVVIFSLVTVLWFFVQFGYFVVFEVLDQGRSLGKRLLHIRVVRADGTAIGFLASAIRNLLRIVDSLPGLYLVGIVAVLVTNRQQRLGDIAADTVIVRDRRVDLGPATWFGPTSRPAPQILALAERWDLSAISQSDIAAVRAFLERRVGLPPEARWRLAVQFDTALRPRVPSVPAHVSAEQFLDAVSWVKATRG